MNKPLALIYAIVGTVMLAAISFFIATGHPWLAIIASVVTFFFIGSGFIVKAKMRKRKP